MGLRRLRLYPKIHLEDVYLLISGLTNLWASEHAAAQIKAELSADEQKALTEKLIGFCKVGYWQLNDRILRHEGKAGGGETWRIAYKNSTQFRIVGFPESDQKRDFIALDAFYKGDGDEYSRAQWNRMKEISEIKRNSLWRKKP